jgi:hypothetical protein
MESGRYVAHEIAKSLGLPNALPNVPAQPPVALVDAPTTAPFSAELVAKVLAKVHEAVTGPNADALREGFRTSGLGGPNGFAAWMRDLLGKTLTEAGHTNVASDAMALATALRDFAISTVTHARDAAATDVHAHVAALDDHLTPKT